jgi:hypothetical protein
VFLFLVSSSRLVVKAAESEISGGEGCTMKTKYGRVYLEGAQEILIDGHHCGGVVEFSAIIWSRE